jgi:hypothetical protein
MVTSSASPVAIPPVERAAQHGHLSHSDQRERVQSGLQRDHKVATHGGGRQVPIRKRVSPGFTKGCDQGTNFPASRIKRLHKLLERRLCRAHTAFIFLEAFRVNHSFSIQKSTKESAYDVFAPLALASRRFWQAVVLLRRAKRRPLHS